MTHIASFVLKNVVFHTESSKEGLVPMLEMAFGTDTAPNLY